MSKELAGWRSRRHATIQNCGRVTQVIMWKAVNTDAFHLVEKIKDMGSQEITLSETILPFDEAYPRYTAMVTEALLEEVVPPNTGKAIVGVIDGEDEE